MSDFIEKIIVLIIILTSVAIHEFSHCWTTDRFGDPTPRNEGRVTLNPLVHLDLFGTIMIIVSTFSGFGFGWGKPSPFNPSNFKNPAFGRMITAFAGPMSNFIQMFAWVGILQIVNANIFSLHEFVNGYLFVICYYGIILNAVLGLFNLLPFYPLDGHHILSYFVPIHLRPIIDNPNWQWVLLVLIFTGFISNILHPIVNVAKAFAFYLTGIS